MAWTRRRYDRRFLIIGLTFVLSASLLTLAAWLMGWFSPRDVLIEIGTPGAARQEASSFQLDKSTADAMEARMILLLRDERTGLLAQRYTLAGRFGEPPAERSAVIMARDQLIFGQYLLEQDRRDAFRDWWRLFSNEFRREDHLFDSITGQNQTDQNQTGIDLHVNMSVLRLLAQSISRWPDQHRQADLLSLSDQMLKLGSSGFAANYDAAVPTVPPIPDPGATPTPRPSVTPAVTDPIATLRVLSLSSIDLYTMRQLSSLDSRWQSLYDRYLPIVRDGYINDNLPLYALGYIEGTGYLPFSGISPAVNTAEALRTLLHLCEVGEDNPRSISWLRDQLFNRRAIYESYHIAQNTPFSSAECIPSYAIVARIARIKGDADLYQAAVNRLLWHQATSRTSAAFSAVFREESSGLFHILALDNSMALLALR